MNKYTISLIAILASTAAMASDLPSKSAPTPPVRAISYSQDDFFVGAHLGSKAMETAPWGTVRTNIRGGWEFSNFARLEADYDHASGKNKRQRSDSFTTNLIGQYKLDNVPITPYGLIGGGYRWSGLKDETIYNVGGGVRYNITNNLEADLRYRYITDADRSRDENVVTLGVNYKF